MATVERYRILKSFGGMLPEPCQLAHGPAILQRHHLEPLEKAVLGQKLAKVKGERGRGGGGGGDGRAHFYHAGLPARPMSPHW